MIPAASGTVSGNGGELLRPGGALPRAAFDWGTLIDTYIVQSDLAEASKRSYSKALVAFFRWLEAEGGDPGHVRDFDVVMYRTHLLEDEPRHSEDTMLLYMNAIRGLFRWLSMKGVYPDITRDIRNHRDYNPRQDGFVKLHLTEEQVVALMKHMGSRGGVTAVRDEAMIRLMINCGLRTKEVAEADCGDLRDEQGRHVLYVRGKRQRDKRQFVVVPEPTYGVIRSYLDTRADEAPDAPLFSCPMEGRTEDGADGGHLAPGRRMAKRTVQHICKEALRAIGLDSHAYSAHSLRHTTGSLILKATGNLEDVRTVLRHASSDTSKIYTKSIEKELRFSRPAEEVLSGVLDEANTTRTTRTMKTDSTSAVADGKDEKDVSFIVFSGTSREEMTADGILQSARIWNVCERGWRGAVNDADGEWRIPSAGVDSVETLADALRSLGARGRKMITITLSGNRYVKICRKE